MDTFDDILDQAHAVDLESPWLSQTVEPSDSEEKFSERKKKRLETWYNPGQLRDEAGRFEDEGKASESPHYERPDVARLTGIDKRIVDVVTHRPLTRESPDVVSIGQFVPQMHYVSYSKTPFFDTLNKMQGTPDPEIDVVDFLKARKHLFQRQPEKKLPINSLIATQPVVNSDKVERNIDEKKIKNAFVVQYGGRNFVMDGHHAVAAAAALGKKNIKANVLHITTGLHKFRIEMWYSPDQARDERGRFADEGGGAKAYSLGVHKAHEFYSPNTGEMDFTQAAEAMNGTRQVAAHEISHHIDQQMFGSSDIGNYRYHDAIGDWQDGAENSIVAELGNIKDMDELRYNAALKGNAMRQKAVLAFEEDKQGKDAIYNIKLHNNNIDQIRSDLDKAGIKYRTIAPEGDAVNVMVFSKGNGDDDLKNVTKFGRLQEKNLAPDGITITNGNGEFVGEAEGRTEAGKNYDQIIRDYEAKYPDRKHYTPTEGPGVRDNGSQVAPATQPPEDSGLTTSGVTIKGANVGHSSDVYKVQLANGRNAIWKPESGEPPTAGDESREIDGFMRSAIRDNISGPLYKREVSVYRVAKELNVADLFPETVEREVEGDKGSMSEFVYGVDALQAGLQDRFDGARDLARAAAFDYLTGQTDRNLGNWMLEPNGKMKLVDNNLSFPDERKGWSGNRRLIDQASRQGLKIPDEATQWADHMPQVRKIMEEEGLPEESIKGVERRADTLRHKSSFSGLGVGFNSRGRGE